MAEKEIEKLNGKVSVIVPVYNTEKYLRECIESILNMSYPELEVILVDDGSMDSSGLICDEYSNKDKRVKVIHKPNGGLSSARNAGLDIFSGEYVCFIDSDDIVKKEFAEKLIAVLCTDPLAGFAFCDFEDTRRPELKEKIKGTGDNAIFLEKEDYKSLLSDHKSREYVDAVIVCNKIFRRDLFTGLRFSEGRWHEDEFFTNILLKDMRKCVFLPQKLYIYRINEEGITGKVQKSDVRHLDVFDAYTERIQNAKQERDRDFAKKTAENGLSKIWELIKEEKASKPVNKPYYKALKKRYSSFYRTAFKYIGVKKKLKYLAGFIYQRFL